MITSSPTISLGMRGTIFVALSGLMYGVMGFLGTSLIREGFAIDMMLCWRFLFAMLWTLCILFLIPSSSKINYKNPLLWQTILFGILSYSGSSFFYFMASESIGTGLAMVIFFSFPIFVCLFSWLNQQWRMNKYGLFSLTFLIIGLSLLKGEGQHAISITGVCYAMLAGLSYAIYIYRTEDSLQKIDTNLFTLVICFGNALLFFGFACFNHHLKLPTTYTAWFYSVGIGVIATALPIQLLLYGIKYISTVKAAIFSVFEPLGTVVVGFFLLHETVSKNQALGIVIVLIAALIIQFEKDSSLIQTEDLDRTL